VVAGLYRFPWPSSSLPVIGCSPAAAAGRPRSRGRPAAAHGQRLGATQLAGASLNAPCAAAELVATGIAALTSKAVAADHAAVAPTSPRQAPGVVVHVLEQAATTVAVSTRRSPHSSSVQEGQLCLTETVSGLLPERRLTWLPRQGIAALTA
jgi:hypothetical protein